MNTQPTVKLTIDQVAEYCGVSKTTISRFLNGKYGNMSADTRERIASGIQDLNYRPNRTAQSLKASRTMLVGCVIADISSPFSAILLKGITKVCEENGYQVLFADSRENAARERRAIEGFLENRVDGLIVNTCGENDEYLLGLLKRGVPTVLADRELMTDGLMDTVTSPNRRTSADCTQFLFDRGYENVAFFSETIGSISPRLHRRSGYLDAVKARNGDKAEVYEFTPDSHEECIAAVKTFVDCHPGERSAILCSNGKCAQQVLMAINALGLVPGHELGLCTFDDWDWLHIARPGITAVSLSSAEIGAKAAELLIKRLSGDMPEDGSPVWLTVPTELIERESTL